MPRRRQRAPDLPSPPPPRVKFQASARERGTRSAGLAWIARQRGAPVRIGRYDRPTYHLETAHWVSPVCVSGFLSAGRLPPIPGIGIRNPPAGRRAEADSAPPALLVDSDRRSRQTARKCCTMRFNHSAVTLGPASPARGRLTLPRRPAMVVGAAIGATGRSRTPAVGQQALSTSCDHPAAAMDAWIVAPRLQATTPTVGCRSVATRIGSA